MESTVQPHHDEENGRGKQIRERLWCINREREREQRIRAAHMADASPFQRRCGAKDEAV